MSISLIVLIICFLLLMVIGLPIAYNLLVSTFIYLLVAGINPVQLAIKMYAGMNSFNFLAVPFFVMTGQLMLRGGLLDTLVKFVNVWFGNLRGAIAIVTIVASLLMGAIVGLAVAAAASLGVFLIPMMKKQGYSSEFSAAVMSSASLLGPIMPPSVLMILYCSAVGSTSISGLFMAAVTPAVLITLLQCLVAHRTAVRRGYPAYGKTTMKERGQATLKAIPVLLLPVIILGGIFGGIFSITEASGVAV
ncbi:MAG: TRAP transporter large permease subunit, partial [Oscillospiraceae bacterium]|nr:TRAP transporter large permease subunit [Oscillospiraceae bacterium]